MFDGINKKHLVLFTTVPAFILFAYYWVSSHLRLDVFSMQVTELLVYLISISILAYLWKNESGLKQSAIASFLIGSCQATLFFVLMLISVMLWKPGEELSFTIIFQNVFLLFGVVGLIIGVVGGFVIKSLAHNKKAPKKSK